MNSLSIQETKRVLSVIEDLLEELRVFRHLPPQGIHPESALKKVPAQTLESIKTLYDDEWALEQCFREDKFSDRLPELTERSKESAKAVCHLLRVRQKQDDWYILVYHHHHHHQTVFVLLLKSISFFVISLPSTPSMLSSIYIMTPFF